MEVFSLALQKKAYHIILVQNHPSGALNPSDADKEITGKMLHIGKFLNVPVWDHLIITVKSYYSFRDSGLLDNVEATTKSIVPDALREVVLKRETAEMNLVKTTAKIVINLYKQNMDSKSIAVITELEEDEVKRIIAESEQGEEI